MKLAYCDKIADTIRKSLLKYDTDGILNGPVGRIEMDLHPTQGYFVSSKKLIKVWDSNGKAYTVTVEEQPALDIEFEDVDDLVTQAVDDARSEALRMLEILKEDFLN